MDDLFKKSEWFQNLKKFWHLKLAILVIILIVLSVIQIYVGKKDPIFAIFHSLLISSLVAV